MRKLVLFVGLLLAAAPAYAGTFPVTFLGWSGGEWQNGYPYYVTFGGTGTPTAVMCDDYVHGGIPGMTWQANITDLGTNNLSLTRFNTVPNALTLYDEAGWILLETRFTSSNQWSSMNYAVWHIFDPGVPLSPLAQSWLNQALAEAAKGFPGVNFNAVDILTPVNQHDPDPNSIQEFLYLTPTPNAIAPNAIPEPSTVLLLGAGLLGFLRLICCN
jgi:PEP-CTERM motif